MSHNLIRSALIAAFGAMLTLPTFAHATVMQSTAAAEFKLSEYVDDKIDLTKPGASTRNVNLGTTQVNKFNASTGVLTGAKVNLTSKQEQVTFVTTTSAAGGNNKEDGSASGLGSSTVKLVVPNNVSETFSTLTQDDTCGGKVKSACVGLASTKEESRVVAISSAYLSDYAGSGTFGVNHTAALSAETISNTLHGEATTRSTVNWNGNLSATYSYLEHAAQSFGSTSAVELNLDFGTVYLGDTVASQAFSIFNLAGDRVALQLTGFSASGDSSNLFSTDLDYFSNLAAGISKAFQASFQASALGSFGATYQLTLADVAPDVAYAANTLGLGYGLTLNLSGNVVERPVENDVPEPASLMLLGVGAAALGASRKRKA
jgi:hypothetical protein